MSQNFDKTQFEKGFANIALVVVIVILLGVVGYFAFVKKLPPIAQQTPTPMSTQTKTPVPTPTPTPKGETANWKTYTNTKYGFEVKYPSDVFKLDEVSLALVHKLKSLHSYSLKDGSDLGLATDISLTFKPGPATCDYLENTLKIQSLGVPFTLGGIKGVSYEMGAEGEGVVDYCIKGNENKNVFAIERKFLNESYDINLSKQSDYISSAEQTKLADQVLSTFKLLGAETMTVKVYFRDSNANSSGSCGVLVPIIRVISKTEKVATAAITELLKGPTDAEKLKGYSTDIPSSGRLNSLVIVNGEARADFSSATESGGSCNLTTDQITKTLLQFSTVKTVKLSVDGRTQDIFQP